MSYCRNTTLGPLGVSCGIWHCNAGSRSFGRGLNVCATPYLENAPHLPHSVTEPPDTLTVKVRSVKGAQRPVHRSGPKQRHQTETVIYKFIINTKIAMKALKQRASVVRLGRKE